MREAFSLWDCSRRTISDDIFTRVAECNPQLRDLNLHECASLSDSGIGRAVALCTGLTRLNLSKCAASDQTIDALRQLRGLTDLDVSSCSPLDLALLGDVSVHKPTV